MWYKTLLSIYLFFVLTIFLSQPAFLLSLSPFLFVCLHPSWWFCLPVSVILSLLASLSVFFAILLLCLFGFYISSVFTGSSPLSFSCPFCLSLVLLFMPVCLAVSSCLSPCLSVPEWAPLSAFFYLSVLQKIKRK